jgi:preprotein translocase subunit SecG
MSRNEIRIRRHKMGESASDRFRNYSEVMRRHERDMRIKELTRVLVIFMFVVIILLGVIYFMVTAKKANNAQQGPATRSATYAPDSPSKP